jgi:hypothetical protein
MKKLKVLLLMMAPLSVFGHAGHGIVTNSSIFHYLSEPIHFVPIVVIGFLVAIYARKELRLKQK